ncbi:hypothetical protein [Antribacter gilvus]|uniref:hypothetical protein n=1 Tax=Antribacter gilvus TaxID=2304675 RepID=UPI001F0BBAE1|nr:hypothetical protein [Antribacter gilvus]
MSDTHGNPTPGSPADEPTTPDDLPGLDDLDFEIPDDLSSLTNPTTDPELAVLVTQIAGAGPLAAACALSGLDVDAVPTSIGALAVLRDRAGDAPEQAAAAISGLVRGVPLVLVTRRGEQLTALRFTDGERGDELSPGLVLGGAPEELEDLLTGFKTVAELDGVVASSSISRFKAVRLLTSAARKARRKPE